MVVVLHFMPMFDKYDKRLEDSATFYTFLYSYAHISSFHNLVHLLTVCLFMLSPLPLAPCSGRYIDPQVKDNHKYPSKERKKLVFVDFTHFSIVSFISDEYPATGLLAARR